MRRMRRTALRLACALALALPATACGNPTPSPAPPWDRAHAEREVLFVVLRDVVATKDSSRFVLSTDRRSAYSLRRTDMPEAKACTFEDLAAAQSGELPLNLRGPAPIDWLDGEAFSALAPEPSGPDGDSMDDDYAAFWKKFPGSPGMTSLSHIGFSCDRSEALVEVGAHRGSLDGQGLLVLLRRGPTGWTVVKAVETWIS